MRTAHSASRDNIKRSLYEVGKWLIDSKQSNEQGDDTRNYGWNDDKISEPLNYKEDNAQCVCRAFVKGSSTQDSEASCDHEKFLRPSWKEATNVQMKVEGNRLRGRKSSISPDLVGNSNVEWAR